MHGLFVSDVRALTEARLRFGGREPHPLAVLPEGAGATRFVAVARGFGDPIADPTVRVDRVRQVAPDGMAEEIRIVSAATRPVRAWLTVDLRLRPRPRCESAKAGAVGPTLAGRERRRPALRLGHAGGSRSRRDGGRRRRHGRGPRGAALAGRAGRPGSGRDAALAGPGARHATRCWPRPAGPVEWSRPAVRGDDPRLARLLARSLDDLESLRLADAGRPATARSSAPACRGF